MTPKQMMKADPVAYFVSLLMVAHKHGFLKEYIKELQEQAISERKEVK
jgi:hypothetical protein